MYYFPHLVNRTLVWKPCFGEEIVRVYDQVEHAIVVMVAMKQWWACEVLLFFVCLLLLFLFLVNNIWQNLAFW